MPQISDPAIVCAENIAISSLFHNIPVPPSLNTVGRAPPDKGKYTFSFDRERKLAGTLAFLAHIKDGADHIPAVCIEEDPNSASLNVILAVNKAKAHDGDEVIRRIQQGFDGIFTILGRLPVDPNGSLNIKNQILFMVVSMCSSRILSRLRLGPAGGKAKKRPIKDTLQEAAMALKKIGRHKLEDRNLLITAELLAARIKEVARLVDSWSRYQVSTARLIDLIEGIHQIQQIEQLPALINIIPNCNMSPSARESFLNIIGKVSRYREAARFLYRTAKRFPLAQKMRTIPVRLSREAFSTPSTDKYTPDLLSKIIKASPKDRQQKLLKEICRVLDLSEQKATDQFSQQVKKTLNEAKIHAEVQIIAYCELRSPKLLPRVICSSKDACFLCNLLIRVYGKIHIPRSHGRLYPGWRLPRVPQLGELERRFCQSLEENFRESCTALLSTGRRTLYPCPNESTFFTLATSGTTVRNTTSSEVSQMAKLKDEKVLVPPKLEPHDVQNTYGIAKPEGNDSLRDLSHKPYLRTQRQRQSIRSRSDLVLLQGSKKYGFLGPKGTSELYFAGPLEIQIECTAESTNLVYYIEWLDNEEATKARGKSSSLPLVDAERLEEKLPYAMIIIYTSLRGIQF